MTDADSTLDSARVEIADSNSLASLEDIRLRYLGKKGLLTVLLKSLGDLPVEERLEGTAATVAASIMQGADIIRVHDVREMVRVARVIDRLKVVPSNGEVDS